VWQSFLSIFPHLLGGTMATSQRCCHLPGKMLNSAAECADRAQIRECRQQRRCFNQFIYLYSALFHQHPFAVIFFPTPIFESVFFIFCCFAVLDFGIVAAADASNSSSSSSFSLCSSFFVWRTDFV
jgi:hypothetical protein